MGGTLPSCFHCSTSRSGRFLMMSRRALMIVSGVLAQNWIDRSPWQKAGSSASLKKRVMRCRWRGLTSFRPKRSSNIESPSETVMVSASGVTTGPSRPELAGGSLGSSCTSLPPWVRKAMRAVSVRNRRSSSSLSWASTENEASMPALGRGVTTPAWCTPRYGTRSWKTVLVGASVTCPAPSWSDPVLAAAASAAAAGAGCAASPARPTVAAPTPPSQARRPADCGAPEDRPMPAGQVRGTPACGAVGCPACTGQCWPAVVCGALLLRSCMKVS